MKKEQLYKTLLEARIVTFDEILEAAKAHNIRPSPNYILGKYVGKLIEDKKMCRIRRGLYWVLEPLEEPSRSYPDKFLVGSKIRKGCFLGFHTALELHGHSYSATYNEVYVCVRKQKRFAPFVFRGINFRPVYVGSLRWGVMSEKYRGAEIRFTDRERTFIDCISKIRYAGGWEECVKSLETLGGLDFQKVFEYLLRYHNQFLTRKVGLVLELMKKRSMFYDHLEDRLLEKIHKLVKGPPGYLDRTGGGEMTLNERWLLYVPRNFEEIVFRGV